MTSTTDEACQQARALNKALSVQNTDAWLPFIEKKLHMKTYTPFRRRFFNPGRDSTSFGHAIASFLSHAVVEDDVFTFGPFINRPKRRKPSTQRRQKIARRVTRRHLKCRK